MDDTAPIPLSGWGEATKRGPNLNVTDNSKKLNKQTDINDLSMTHKYSSGA